MLVSQRLAEQLRAGDAPVLFYEATPRLVIASFGPATGAAIDLRRNSVRAVARKASGSDVVRANLARSVVDAAVESALLASGARPDAGASRIAGIDIFGRARAEGIRLVAARAGTPLTTVHAPDVALARMGMHGVRTGRDRARAAARGASLSLCLVAARPVDRRRGQRAGIGALRRTDLA